MAENKSLAGNLRTSLIVTDAMQAMRDSARIAKRHLWKHAMVEISPLYGYIY